MSTLATVERRRSYRANVMHACARCASDDAVGLYSVEDLSMGGALLRGLLVPVETPVALRLLLPGQAPVAVTATVVRASDEGLDGQVAVQFESLGADVEDAIEDSLILEFMRQHMPVALVADGSREDGYVFTHCLQQLGHGARQVTTPLDVITCLDNVRIPVDTVFVAEDFGGEAPEFSHFMADAYPRIRRVLLLRGTECPAWADGLFHGVVRRPWRESDVLAVLPERRRPAPAGRSGRGLRVPANILAV